MTLSVASVEKSAVADARALPGVVSVFTAAEPALAADVTGKALIASRTPWGTLMVSIVAWLAARYGFGWSADIDALVAGLGVLAGSYAMRAVTSLPIAGLFRKPAPAIAVLDVSPMLGVPTVRALPAVLALMVCATSVSGCAGFSLPTVTAAVNVTISKAQTDVQTAVNAYGVAKGLAEVASIADPALAPFIGMATATLDPLVAKAQTAMNDATTDANALEALATAINAQASALTAKAAPAVVVVPRA